MRRGGVVVGVLAGVLLLAAPSRTLQGQARVPVNSETRVGSVDFSFAGSRSFTIRRLEGQLALPGLQPPSFLRRTLSRLPGMDPVEASRFSPLELQQDVARLRRFYTEAGFPSVDVSYDLILHPENVLDIVFSVDEGDPVVVSSVTYVWSDSGAPANAHHTLGREWDEEPLTGRLRVGDRADNFEIAAFGREIVGWVADRGYPFARVSTEVSTDSTQAGRVSYQITRGARARIASVAIEGNERLTTPIIERQLGLREGEWYSAVDFREGEVQVLGLDLIRSAVTDLPEGAVIDSAVAVRLRVSEGNLHLMSGGAGYVSRSGVALEGQWDHRDFTGGARVLSVTGLAETGALAIDANSDVLYRGAVSLRQPYLWSRRLSLLGSAEAEYRDDLRDESWALAGEGSIIYERGPLRALALSYRLEARRLLDRRLGGLAPEVYTLRDGLRDEEVAPGVTTDRPNSGVLSLTAVLGDLDDLRTPTRGFTLRPSVAIAGPARVSTTEYVRLDAVMAGFLPVSSRATLVARFSTGRLFPIGKSIPNEGEGGLEQFNDLSDVVFTAGGGADVRGWGNSLLGSKHPDVTVDSTGAEPALVGAGRYLPVGGLARLAGTLEARLPFPGVVDNLGLHFFLDGGRVWTPDDRFGVVDEAIDHDGFFFASGGGLDLFTPVGLVRASLGFKLNPSPLDLRDPNDVLVALVAGTAIDDVEERWQRRFQLHLSIGRVF